MKTDPQLLSWKRKTNGGGHGKRQPVVKMRAGLEYSRRNFNQKKGKRNTKLWNRLSPHKYRTHRTFGGFCCRVKFLSGIECVLRGGDLLVVWGQRLLSICQLAVRISEQAVPHGSSGVLKEVRKAQLMLHCGPEHSRKTM